MPISPASGSVGLESDFSVGERLSQPLVFSIRAMPSSLPSSSPRAKPSSVPRSVASGGPSVDPSGSPTVQLSSSPSSSPSAGPSGMPSSSPMALPSATLSSDPSVGQSAGPSSSPSAAHRQFPSAVPSPTTSTSRPAPRQPALLRVRRQRWRAEGELAPSEAPSSSQKLGTPIAYLCMSLTRRDVYVRGVGAKWCDRSHESSG